MRLLMRFMRPYRGLIAVTLFAVLIDNIGTLLVPIRGYLLIFNNHLPKQHFRI